jgi:hypothetical protein
MGLRNYACRLGMPNMQKFLLAAMAVASIALFAPVSEVEGQSNNEPAVAPAPRTVNLTAEQRFVIKDRTQGPERAKGASRGTGIDWRSSAFERRAP